MNKALLLLFGLFPLAGFSKGITAGQYQISFGVSDAGWAQVVKLANFTTNLVCTYFDVIIEEDGSFKWPDQSRQLVRGLIYLGKFKFIIPEANADHVKPYIFEADDKDKNGKFEGSCDVLFTGPHSDRTGKFHFTMQRVAPKRIVPANRSLPLHSETNRPSSATGSCR